VNSAAARRALITGSILLALATAIGAFAAHALKTRLAADRFAVLQTAVLYQFIHGLGLLILGVLAAQRAIRGLGLAIALLLVGVVLFSGSLYLLLCGAPRLLGVLTPVGGLCLIAGWCAAAWVLWRAAGAGIADGAGST
jgi:uncharacterized membrane protein YgdD (TMEM256/DUF423 family)